jgi:hypothetical protein
MAMAQVDLDSITAMAVVMMSVTGRVRIAIAGIRVRAVAGRRV